MFHLKLNTRYILYCEKELEGSNKLLTPTKTMALYRQVNIVSFLDFQTIAIEDLNFVFLISLDFSRQN